MALGRPIEYDREKLLADLEKYVNETEIPIAAEFAYLNGMSRSYLYEIPEISDAIKWLITKKEAQLERKGMNNEINTAMAIMGLKQLGWKDKPDSDGASESRLNIVISSNQTDDSNIEVHLPTPAEKKD